MMRASTIICLALPLAIGLAACADRDKLHADQMEAEAAVAQADDANCRSQGVPGTKPYAECRKALAEARVAHDVAKEQRARDFDRVLGNGTRGLSDNF